MLAAAAALAAAQPANQIEADGRSWWGASVWVVITLVPSLAVVSSGRASVIQTRR